MLISLVQMLFAMQVGINLFVIALHAIRAKITPHTRRIGNLIMLVWALRYFLIYIKFEDWVLEFPFLLVIDQYLFFLDGLLLWMYSRTFLKKKFSYQSLIHFIPFVLLVALAIINSIQNPERINEVFSNTVTALLNSTPIFRIEIILFFAVILAVSLIYFFKSRKEVKAYSARLKSNYSNIDRIAIDWVLTYQKLWLVLFIVPLIIYSLNYVYPTTNYVFVGALLTVAMMTLSLYFNFHILNQQHVILKSGQDPSEADLPSEADEEQLDRLYRKLASEKYYQDEHLSLNQLADKMEMKPVGLTNLIKKSKYENFYDLINSFRINAVKTELRETSEQIIVIAYQCGFNSKSAFNKIFKEKTGMTPKEFRNNKSI